MMREKIRNALHRAGLEDVPTDEKASLTDAGLDSLLIVLCVSELEREFKIKIPAAKMTEDIFENLSSIEAFMKNLGAK